MKKIKQGQSGVLAIYYNSEKESMTVIFASAIIKNIPTDARIYDGDATYWNCYLYKIKYIAKTNCYHTEYKLY